MFKIYIKIKSSSCRCSILKGKNDKFIIFSEWSLGMIKLKEEILNLKILDYAPFEKGTLFSDLGDEVIIPSPIKDTL